MYRTILLHHPSIIFSARPRAVRSRRRGLPFYFKMGISVFLVSAVVLGFATYLVLTNNIVKDVFRASEYRQTLQNFEEQNRRLAIEFARLNSFNAILERSRDLNMVAASGFEYIEISDNSFAFMTTPTP